MLKSGDKTILSPNSDIVIVGAGINGLVAANYLRRAGHEVSVVEIKPRVGGACISAVAEIEGSQHHYAHGASVLGLMQDFVWEETGLKKRLPLYAPEHPKLVHFPGQSEPTWIYREPERLDQEFANKWGEKGDLEAFRRDEEKVVSFLQEGYRHGTPPSLDRAGTVLGSTLTRLWITGSARELLDHYLTAEGTKVYMAMTVTESGPVSLDEPYSAFTIPMMDSGSVLGSYYGFVKGGIWRVTEELEAINRSLGVKFYLSTSVQAVDPVAGHVIYENSLGSGRLNFDHLCLATDTVTAARLLPDKALQEVTQGQKLMGSAGKLNLMFRNPVQWRHGSSRADSDAAFRFIFSVNTLEEFEQSTLRVMDPSVAYSPGYAQIYCEGAAMRKLRHDEPLDRLAVFFKNLALGENGDSLPAVEQQVKEMILSLVKNPGDCVWSRLLTPRDLQQTFLFPGGNLDHTMLVGGQSFADRNFANRNASHSYQFGSYEQISLCGAGSYPCGSVAGTPGYMCATQLSK